MDNKPIDLLIWGCTGTTGSLLCSIIAKRFGLNSNIRFGLAGRSENKLRLCAENMLQESIEYGESSEIRDKARSLLKQYDAFPDTNLIPMYIVPSIQNNQMASLDSLGSICSKAHVVIALGGPYSKIGEPIIAACAKHGVDYVDVTGEITWVKQMYNKYNEMAQKSKARIIPCQGVMAFLMDYSLSTVFQYAKKFPNQKIQGAEQLVDLGSMKPSKGTIQTILNLAQSWSIKDLFTKKQIYEPYELCSSVPTDNPEVLKNNLARFGFYYSPLSKRWKYNTPFDSDIIKYIHWTNEWKNYAFGKNFMYNVGAPANSCISAIFNACLLSIAHTSLYFASFFKFIHPVMSSMFGNKATLQQRLDPKFNVTIQTVGLLDSNASENKKKIVHTVNFVKGDPYCLTAYAALEVALDCLEQRKNLSEIEGGFKSSSQTVKENFTDKLQSTGKFVTHIDEC